MVLRFTILAFFIAVFGACTNHVDQIESKSRKIKIDDVLVEGDISNDTTYRGVIKTYNAVSGKILYETTYDSNGIENGLFVQYDSEGNVQLKANLTDGKVNGHVKIFDSTGQLIQDQFRYYDLRTGPSIVYKNGKLQHYYFYSLENSELLHIDYDSMPKELHLLNNNKFFFWHINQLEKTEHNKYVNQFFIYTPNPPKIQFKYSLCVVDKKLNILTTKIDFETNQNWQTTKLDYTGLKQGEFFAISLIIDSELDNDERTLTLIKRID